MTNEQLLALAVAALIGFIPNVIIKYLEKHKSKIEEDNIEVDTLTEALKTMREHNDFLEKKLGSKREEITIQNKMMYDINFQNATLTTQNLELTAKVSEMTTQLLDIAIKLQECIKCVDTMKKENGE
jgi:predicted RNase H-like nuclease (RuvC/YqgF family)